MFPDLLRDLIFFKKKACGWQVSHSESMWMHNYCVQERQWWGGPGACPASQHQVSTDCHRFLRGETNLAHTQWCWWWRQRKGWQILIPTHTFFLNQSRQSSSAVEKNTEVTSSCRALGSQHGVNLLHFLRQIWSSLSLSLSCLLGLSLFSTQVRRHTHAHARAHIHARTLSLSLFFSRSLTHIQSLCPLFLSIL